MKKKKKAGKSNAIEPTVMGTLDDGKIKPQEKMAFCPMCGERIRKEDKICDFCLGKKKREKK